MAQPYIQCVYIYIYRIYILHKYWTWYRYMDLCGGCSGNHLALKDILSYKLLPDLYISKSIKFADSKSRHAFGAFSVPAHSIIPHCRCRAAFSRKKFGEAQESLRRLLAGQHMGSQGCRRGWFNCGASHQPVSHSNIRNILFGQNMKWFTRQSKTDWKNKPASHGTISLDVETSALRSRSIWSC